LSSALDDDEDDGGEDATGRHAPLVIGGYRLLGEIARGGAGVVHRAWQPALKREVALKRVLSARLENRESLDRFQREAELMAGLDHPGILPVYEIGLHEGVPWFSMKLAEQGNLAERAATLHGRYDEIARVLVRVARAVQHAHDRGVLHRDLKPSNIVFDREGQPLVTDFGLARQLSVDSTLTGADALIGTPRYVAPEMIATPGAKLTIAVDVYGLGAILYELLTGAPPFSELAPL
jgi:serine/threonine-protein kinase